MSTPKSKNTANNFAGLTGSLISTTNQPATPEATMSKDKMTSFELKGELRQPLDRVVHGLGRKASIRSVINTALAYYFENEPKAKRLAGTPTPEEENGNE